MGGQRERALRKKYEKGISRTRCIWAIRSELQKVYVTTRWQQIHSEYSITRLPSSGYNDFCDPESQDKETAALMSYLLSPAGSQTLFPKSNLKHCISIIIYQ